MYVTEVFGKKMKSEITNYKESLEDIVRLKLSHFLEKAKNCDIEDLYPVVLAQVEKPLIELTLKRSSGNQLQAARMLGINRNTLRKKIQELKIDHPSRLRRMRSRLKT